MGDPAALTYYADSPCQWVPISMSQGGDALGAQACPARLTETYVAAGFSSARGAADTPYNLVLAAEA